jgi:hypothetical protein
VFGNHKGPVLTGAGLAALGLGALALFGALPFWPLLVAFAAIGFATAVIPVALAHGKALLPPHLIGRGLTVLNMASMGGVFLSQTISGMVIGLFPVGADGAYPLMAYRAAFGLQAIFLLAGSAIYLWSHDPSRPASEKTQAA